VGADLVIQVTPQMRILVAVDPVDFRKGIDGLARVCRERLAEDPFRGTLFLFRNRRQTTIKGICFDGQGFWMFQKRLSRGKFRWWPSGTGGLARQMAVHELTVLLWNGDPRRVRIPPPWKALVSSPPSGMGE
jgi:transposase